MTRRSSVVPGTATFSACGTYRYTLTRWIKDGDSLEYINFVLLNPSTADAEQDDPTIRRCRGFAEAWGHYALVVTNLFAYRATDPRAMRAADDPVGPENNHILGHIAIGSSRTVVAWGNHGNHQGRAEKVLSFLPGPLWCLGITGQGQPKHPLYLARSTELVPYPIPNFRRLIARDRLVGRIEAIMEDVD